MKRNNAARAWAVGLGVLVLGATAAVPARGQSWRTPTGSAQAAWVSTGSGTTAVASTALPAGGGMGQVDQAAVSVAGLLTASSATAVTTGSASMDRLGVQGVATAADVNVLSGRITASRVIAIATVSDLGSKTTVDGDGSGASGLVIDGVPYAETIAPNTRVELPGAGYVVLNEQLRGKGRGAALTVNMIHVYLTGATTGEVIVASVTSSSGG